ARRYDLHRTEVAPDSWTADHLCSRSPRCRRAEEPIRLSSAVRWLSWCALVARRRNWRASLIRTANALHPVHYAEGQNADAVVEMPCRTPLPRRRRSTSPRPPCQTIVCLNSATTPTVRLKQLTLSEIPRQSPG